MSTDLALGMGVYSKGGFPQEVMPSQHLKRLLSRKRGAERWGEAAQAEESNYSLSQSTCLRAAGY